MELCCSLLVLPIVFAFQAALLRFAVAFVGGKRMVFGQAFVVSAIALLVQWGVTGLLVGADGGCVGLVLGWLVWSGMVSMLTDLSFGRALVVGGVMAVLQWLLALLLFVTGLAALLGALVVL